MLTEIQKKYFQALTFYLSKGQGSTQRPLASLERQNTNFQNEFKTSMKSGLTEAQATQNGNLYGKNVFKKKPMKTLCQIFMGIVTDQMLIVLMIAAIFSLVIQYFFGNDKSKFWFDGVSILVAVLICSIVATFNDYQKNKQFAELDELSDQTFRYEVLRSGVKKQIHRSEIVVGDIILVRGGMQIPADSILVESIDVIVDESQVTGESHEVYKNSYYKCLNMKGKSEDLSPIMVSGTTVTSGEGRMMAVIVGSDSQMGKFFDLLFENDDEQKKTPLEERLEDLATKIGRFGLYSAIFIFLILIGRLVIEDMVRDGFNIKDDLSDIVNSLIIAVAIIVMAVPQGLPLSVTLTLAFSMKKMYDENNLIKNLASCETMGSVHYVCTDKTGTITQNKMHVVQFSNQQNINTRTTERINFNEQYRKILSNAIFHNTSSQIHPDKGSQTEIALLKFANKYFQQNQKDVRAQNKNQYFKRLPFNSNRKRMTTGHTFGGKHYLYMNGASEQILQASNFIHEYSTNSLQKLNKAYFYEEINRMAKKGLRTVSIAYKIINRIQQANYKAQAGTLEPIQKEGFVFMGLFGIQDLPRPQSKEAIERCRNSGVEVIMVTGDNINTAMTIAHEVQIMKGDNLKCFTGDQFQNILTQKDLIVEQQKQNKKKIKKVNLDTENKQESFKKIIEGLSVVARSNPEHKFLLVDGLIQLHQVVAVTGDGTNDAPALMKADVGLAMGETGTQVAKNAADIVILDDRFDSIVRSIVWGRNIYECIRKFLQFQLTVSFVAVILSVLSAALIKQSVLTAVQMLWVNLIMDSFASLALSTQPPDAQKLLQDKPHSRNSPLITKRMIKHIIGQTIFQIIILMILLFVGPTFLPEYQDEFDSVIGKDLSAKYFKGIAEGTMADGRLYTIGGEQAYKVYFDKYSVHSRHFTFLFNTFVFLQFFNFFCCRKIKDELNIFEGVFSNWLFWMIIFVIVSCQIIILKLLNQFFGLYVYGGLTIQQFFISIGFCILTIPMSLLLRLIPVGEDQEEEGEINKE